MTETIIHNGEVIVDGRPQEVEAPPSSPRAASELDPEEIAARMAKCISQAQAEGPTVTPMEVVNRILQLKSPGGQKLVFTRFDLFQCFAIFSKKLSGETRI